MCDTWIALKDVTMDGRIIFAKNSDRPVFDCQPLQLRPRKHWQAGSKIKTAYLELPQVETTFAHLGSKPYWCWGYEEGINEWGLVIGNEAVFTKPFREQVNEFQQGKQVGLGLLGMELIRLALERCQNARRAVALIGELVESYGQFGSGNPGLPHDMGSYDNAFIIADPNDSWILETAGRRWAARRVLQGGSSISNELSIRTEWDMGSADLESYAAGRGWWLGSGDTHSPIAFDFASAYIDDKTARQVSHLRVMRSRQLLQERSGKITPQWMKRIARDHYEDTFLQGPLFDAANPDFLSLCMHASPAEFTWGNTASSCIAVLPKNDHELPVFWWTPGPPCNGCYVPFFPHGSQLPEIVSRAGKLHGQLTPANCAHQDSFSSGSYWWLFKSLNDWVKGAEGESRPGCYSERNPQVRASFDALEQAFSDQLPQVVGQAVRLKGQDPVEMVKVLDRFSELCLNQVLEVLRELIEK